MLDAEDDDLHGERQVVFIDVELGFRFYRALSHLFEETFHRFQLAAGGGRFIMHGEHYLRLHLADGLGGHSGGNRGDPTYRQHQNIDFTYFFQQFVVDNVPDIAEVADRHAVDFHEINGVLTA